MNFIRTPLSDAMNGMDAVLEVKNLSKKYWEIEAVRDVSFSINPREIVSLLGPNGAGKITTIDMILSVLRPTKGSITIGGRDIATDRSEARERRFLLRHSRQPRTCLNGGALSRMGSVLLDDDGGGVITPAQKISQGETQGNCDKDRDNDDHRLFLFPQPVRKPCDDD